MTLTYARAMTFFPPIPKQLLKHLTIFLVLLTRVWGAEQAFAGSSDQAINPIHGYGTLARLPFREAWYGMYFQEDKIGYSHFRIEPTENRFIIHIDSLIRLTALKKTQQISMRQRVVVQEDLTLVALQSTLRINDEERRVNGIVRNNRLSVDVSVGKDKQHLELPLNDKIFHATAVSLMAPLKGLRDGATYIFYVFNEEVGRIEKVEQRVSQVHGQPGLGGAVWKVSTAIGKQTSQCWMDKKGLTVLDQGPDGSLITILEDENTAKDFLAQKRQSRDMALEVGLVRVTTPIPDPSKIRSLVARVKGIEPSLVAQDHRQAITDAANYPVEGFCVRVTAENTTEMEAVNRGGEEELNPKYLSPSLTIQSDHKDIATLGRSIVSPSDAPLVKVQKLVQWVSKNIKNSPRESFTALSVLRAREGECQAHANLYTALARAVGIPTRIAIGLVYLPESQGFLYHAWAESYVRYWIAVDPTMNQIPADATHIKMDSDEDNDGGRTVLALLGKIHIEVLHYQ